MFGAVGEILAEKVRQPQPRRTGHHVSRRYRRFDRGVCLREKRGVIRFRSCLTLHHGGRGVHRRHARRPDLLRADHHPARKPERNGSYAHHLRRRFCQPLWRHAQQDGGRRGTDLRRAHQRRVPHDDPRGSRTSARLARSSSPMGSWHIFAVALAFLVSWFINKTSVGLNLRAVGENPATADAAGISVTRSINILRRASARVSPAFGGLYYTMDYIKGTWSTDGSIEKLGWLAVALVIFATWKPRRSHLGQLSVRRAVLAVLLHPGTDAEARRKSSRCFRTWRRCSC